MYKIGNKVRVICDTNNHGLEIGTVARVTNLAPSGAVMVDRRLNYWLNPGDIKKILYTKEELAAAIKAAEQQLADLKVQLEYLEEFDLEQAEPEELQVYLALKVLENSDYQLKDKAREIAKIFQS